MKNWEYVVLFVSPLLYSLPDIYAFFTRFSGNSKKKGIGVTLLLILTFVVSRGYLLIMNRFYRSSLISFGLISLSLIDKSIIVIDLLFWLLIKRLDSKEKGIQLVRYSLLNMAEGIMLYPLAFVAATQVQLFIMNYLN